MTESLHRAPGGRDDEALPSMAAGSRRDGCDGFEIAADPMYGIPGIADDLADAFRTHLGIASVADLLGAARDRRLRDLPEFDSRRERKLLNGLLRLQRPEIGITLDWADALADRLIRGIEEIAGVEVVPVGALRRRRDLVATLDVLATCDDPSALFARIAPGGRSRLGRVMGRGSSSRSYPYMMMRVGGGMRARVYVAHPRQRVAALHHLTGSPRHLLDLRGLGPGIDGEAPDASSEEEIYRSFGLDFIPPELRRGNGEVATVREFGLPRLIERSHRRGELHAHTDWSDGRAGVEEMVRAARERDLEYLAITDHSESLHIAGGLSREQILRQGDVIRRIGKEYPDIRVLWGLEVDILEDGTLDMPDELLARLDFVLASAHSGLFASGAEGLTRRLLAAIHHPLVDAIGHPTGRILGIRDPGPPDMPAVLEAARATGTILEINASPDRLDLPCEWVDVARSTGVGLAINTDAHGPEDLDLDRYGIDCARRGWCGPADLVNCSDTGGFARILSTPKRDRWRLFAEREG